MILIYDQPVSRSLPTRLGWALATTILWLLWIALWVPLMALAAWPLGLGILRDYLQWPLALTMFAFESMAFLLLGAVSLSSGCLLIWSCLNYLRFRNANRRARRVPAQLEELADYSALLAETMAGWQTARRVIAYHDEQGRLREAEVLHREPEPEPVLPRLAQGAVQGAEL
jgi:biofilm PGA synthesis protein PgaD